MLREDMTATLGDVIARAIHSHTAPLLARLAALESKEAPALPRDGKDGKDADPIVVKALVAEAVAALPVPKNGERGEKGDKGDLGEPGPVGPQGQKGDQGLQGETGETGAKGDRGEVGPVGPVGPKGDQGIPGEPGLKGDKGDKGDPGATGPAGQNGSPGVDGKDADPQLIKSLQDELTRLREELITVKASIVTAKDGRDGRDGKDADPAMVKALVAEAVAALPVPKDGQPGRDGKDGQPGRDGAKGETGHSVTSALISKDGCLVLTFSDGTTKEVGIVVGRDGRDGQDGIGRDGKDGASVDLNVVKSIVAEAVAEIPKPKDGVNGADGFGFDDLGVVFDEQSGFVLRFTRGSEVKDFPIAAPFDAGVWKPGVTYPKGAGVTVKGAFFIAREQTQTRPDDGTIESARAWRLAVKGGRDGKPGRDGKDAPNA